MALAGTSLGVGTRSDIADYHRLKGEEFDAVVADSGLVPVVVEGWAKPAWADPEALAKEPRGRHRTTLLSPFDSLIWERARTERIFDFTHRLEAYVPKQKRIHGYFAMPLLAGGKLQGRVDPAREGTTLVARQASLAVLEGGGPDGRGSGGGGGLGGLHGHPGGPGRRPGAARAAQDGDRPRAPARLPLTGTDRYLISRIFSRMA